MKPRSAKAKGRKFAKEIAEAICAKLQISPADLQVTPSGVNGPDLYLSPEALKRFPFVLEAKNQESLNIWSALEQAEAHANGTSLTALLAFRRNRTKAFVALSLEDFLTLAAKITGGNEHAEKGRLLL